MIDSSSSQAAVRHDAAIGSESEARSMMPRAAPPAAQPNNSATIRMRNTACSASCSALATERATRANPDNPVASPTAAGASSNSTRRRLATRGLPSIPCIPGSVASAIGTATAAIDNPSAPASTPRPIVSSGSAALGPGGATAPLASRSGGARREFVSEWGNLNSRLGGTQGAHLACFRLGQRQRALAREGHRDRRADALGAADRQRPAMQFGQADRERQAEAGAVMLARPRAGDLAEAGHRQRDFLGAHADPVIGDIDRDGARWIAQHDRNLAAGMAELDRVDQQI